MKKVILTKGLPASGKTTWALKMLEENKGQYKRINKDDLRAMLDGGRWSPDNEKFVLKVRDMLILEALENGKHVIIDDTNLHIKHEERIKQLVKGKALIEIKDFTDVSVDECIKRDLKRQASVGEKVICGMYKQFLAPKQKVVKDSPLLSTCVICDIDGTLALFGDANPYERDFTRDTCNMRIYELLHRLKEDRTIILVSGRMDKFKDQTKEWLKMNAVPYDYLYMRKTDDVRKDVIVKREIYEQEIKGKYNVLFVLDDRNQVVEMWRQEGLTCLQVADGNF